PIQCYLDSDLLEQLQLLLFPEKLCWQLGHLQPSPMLALLLLHILPIFCKEYFYLVKSFE
ncbi:MAG: hypothetical protein ACK55Z_13645, partial [bacterium]